jgi:hypothetical protein
MGKFKRVCGAFCCLQGRTLENTEIGGHLYIAEAVYATNLDIEALSRNAENGGQA